MSAQKLALIDPQLLKDLIFMSKERINPPHAACNPPQDPYLKSMCENETKMQNALKDQAMSDENKVALYNQALDRFMIMNEKQNQSSIPQHQEDIEDIPTEQTIHDLSKIADALDWTSYGGTKRLFKYLKTKGMTINSAGEVVLKGSPIRGSNYKSLIDEFGANRKKLKPDVIGLTQLMTFFDSENLDKNYIINQPVREHFNIVHPKAESSKRRHSELRRIG